MGCPQQYKSGGHFSACFKHFISHSLLNKMHCQFWIYPQILPSSSFEASTNASLIPAYLSVLSHTCLPDIILQRFFFLFSLYSTLSTPPSLLPMLTPYCKHAEKNPLSAHRPAASADSRKTSRVLLLIQHKWFSGFLLHSARLSLASFRSSMHRFSWDVLLCLDWKSVVGTYSRYVTQNYRTGGIWWKKFYRPYHSNRRCRGYNCMWAPLPRAL